MSAGQVVDIQSAQEFMQQALQAISAVELAAIADELADKSRRFRAALDRDKLAVAGLAELRALLRSVFATRRRAGALLDQVGADRFRGALAGLMHGPHQPEERLSRFLAALPEWPESTACDLGAECLHYSDPGAHWLWTRWMWNPQHETGALRLVTMDDFDLRRPTLAQTYLRVGEAVAFVSAVGRAAGFDAAGRGPFGTSVFLACVYAIYMYTVLRLRLTREFNQAIPGLPQLARRLLGVYKMEV